MIEENDNEKGLVENALGVSPPTGTLSTLVFYEMTFSKEATNTFRDPDPPRYLSAPSEDKTCAIRTLPHTITGRMSPVQVFLISF